MRQIVELAREREVRSLAIDVVKSATREATKGALESIMAACGIEPSPGQDVVATSGGTMGEKRFVGGGQTAVAASIVAIMHRMCILLTVLIVLVIYCISPKILQ